MAQTYILSGTDSDLSGGADFSKKLVIPTEGAGSISVTVANSSTEVSYGFTEPGIPGANGTSTGSFTVEVRVGSTGNTNILVRPKLTRINSAGVAQAGPIEPAEAEATCTANTTRTFTWSNPALGTWATGDRLRVDYSFRSSQTMSSPASITVETGTTNTEVITPFAAPPAAVGRSQAVWIA